MAVKNEVTQNKIIPDYLSLDFNTFVERQKTILKSMNYFKDYNYEGSNISVLLEWMAYMSEINTFYLNQISKNVFDDTAELYENKHRIAKLKGYSPRGYISSWTDLKIYISMYDENGKLQYDIGDKLYIPSGTPIYATNLENELEIIPFVIRKPTIITIDEEMFYGDIDSYYDNIEDKDSLDGIYEPPEYLGYIQFNVPIIQGEVDELEYTGADIVDNKLVLPFYNYNHDILDDNYKSTIYVNINDVGWSRVSNFYNNISGLTENQGRW